MRCSNCGKDEANFVYTEIINGVKKEIKLCSECAKKLGFMDMSFNMPSLDFSNFFGDFLNEYDNISLMPSIFSEKAKVLKCNKCGMEYDEFLNEGKFGCGNCYEVFENKIIPLLKQLHGDTKYLGKSSKLLKGSNDLNNDNNTRERIETSSSIKINSLKEELKQAIKVENYEGAAKIRDEIKKLEEQENLSNKKDDKKKKGDN